MNSNNQITQEDPSTAIDVALARLLAINWKREIDFRNHRTQSQRALVHEYMRRLAFWYNSLSPAEESFRYFNAAEAIAPLPEFAKAKIEASWNPYVEQLTQENRKPSYRQQEYCQQYLHWVAVQHLIPNYLANLLSPYDPLILLYERGGDFHFHHHEVQLATGASFGWGAVEDYLIHPKVIKLDNTALDEMDR
jgi:hypothetical protein